MMLEKAEHMEKQYKVLEVFYKEYFKKSYIHIGYWLAAGFLLGISGILVLIPYQEISIESIAIIVMMQILGVIMYISPYRTCLNDRGMIEALYSRVKNLPVSAEAMGKYRFQKGLRIQTRIYVVLQIGQLFVSIVTQYGVVPGNIIYPFLVCFFVPFIILLIDKEINKA